MFFYQLKQVKYKYNFSFLTFLLYTKNILGIKILQQINYRYGG